MIQHRINIIGVAGTGKSFLARHLLLRELGGDSLPRILPMDLVKDGIRFVLNTGGHFSGFSESEARSLQQPSKMLNPGEAMIAARTTGRLYESLSSMLAREHPEEIIIAEGFYIPPLREDVIFLRRDYSWLVDVNIRRNYDRHGITDTVLAKTYTSNSFRTQKLLLRELTVRGHRLIGPETFYIINEEDTHFRVSDDSRIIDVTRFAEGLLSSFDLEGKPSKHISTFREGVAHAYERTVKH